jgi:hypothetical protein
MRNQRRAEKVSLSAPLERLFFRRHLRKREIEALKERCESYQIEAPRPWTGDIYLPYAQYFGLLSALKVKSALIDLELHGYLKVWAQSPVSMMDFGAGTLGASLGALDFLKERNHKISELFAVDQDSRPIEWARGEFRDFLPKKISFQKPQNFDYSLIVAVDVFNEMGLRSEVNPNSSWFKEIESWIERATPNTIILLLEPASRLVNQKFLALRDLLCQKISILLPCTHAKACPALIDDEWCHEEHPYKAPSAYWNLVREMGFRRNLLQFSMIALGKQASQFKREDARMVSRPLKSKGRCEKWLCADGKRWKESQLNRNQNEKNEAFFEAARGDIIDCLSTGINLPD